MAAIFQIRRGTTNVSLTEGELYLHQGSGSLQFGSGSTNYNVLTLNAPVKGDIILTGNITASNAYFSGDVAISGNLFLGNNTGDNISVPGVFTTNLVPGTNGTLDLGTSGAKWRNLYANSVSASFSGSIDGIDVTILSSSIDSQFDALSTISASLISTASANTISIDNLNLFSGSQLTQNTALATITGSLISTSSNQEQRLDAMEAESGSYARTNSANSFVGNQTITGSLVASGSKVEFNVEWPMAPGEQHIIKTDGFTLDNRTYEYAAIALEHYENSPGVLHNSIAMYMFDPTNTYGTDLVVGPYRTHMQMYPSGSGGHLANISVQDLNDGRTQALVYGDFVQIGNIHAESIIIGNSGSIIEISGSIKNAQLNAIGTITGSLIVTASNHEQRIGQLEVVSSSLILTASNHEQRIANVELYTSSLKTAIGVSGSNVTILGDLFVNGTTTTIDSTTIQLGDNIIELNGSAGANGGLLIKDTTNPNTISGSLLWDSTTDYWKGGALGSESKILLAGGDNVFTSSLQLTEINNTTSSLNQTTASLNLFSASVTASLESIYQTTASLNLFSASVTASLDSIYQTTASLNTYTQSVNSDLVSVHQTTASLNLFSASVTASLESIYQTTASLNSYTQSVNSDLVSVHQTTASLNLFSASVTASLDSIYQTTASVNLFSASVTASLESVYQTTASLNLFSASVTASLESIYQTTSSLNNFSASVTASLDSIYQTTASLNSYTSSVSQSVRNLNIFSSSYYLDSASFDYRITVLDPGNLASNLLSIGQTTASLNLFSASVTASLEKIYQTTASLNSYTSSTNVRLDNLESKSASVDISVANLNSYTSSLNGAIQLTGSTVSFLGNIVVYGTQSIINSENLAVTDNLIYLNNGSTVTNPDLGVVGNYNDGTYAHTGIFRDASDNGIWKVFKGYTLEPSGTIDTSHGSFELADFKAATITGTTIVGSIAATNGVISGSAQISSVFEEKASSTHTLISGSSQVNADTITNFDTNVKDKLDSDGVISGSSQVLGILTSLNAYTSSNDTTNTTQNSRLDQLSTASGSAITRLTTLEVETSNLESFTSSINTTIKTRLNAETVISGSSQVSLDSASGNITLATQTTGNYVASLVEGTGVTITNNSGENATPTIAIGQAVGTSSNVQFGSIGVGTTASGVGGEIRATGDIIAYYSSDERLKENIIPIPNALEKVESISGNTYDWKEGFENIHSHTGTDIGVIAQEIEKVLPQAVIDRETGYKAVNYEKVVPLLIEAIKELSAKIKVLENK